MRAAVFVGAVLAKVESLLPAPKKKSCICSIKNTSVVLPVPAAPESSSRSSGEGNGGKRRAREDTTADVDDGDDYHAGTKISDIEFKSGRGPKSTRQSQLKDTENIVWRFLDSGRGPM